MSDLIKAHEGNEDFHAEDPHKIHWGKFNMMGRFISHTMHCQAQCKMATDYNFPDRNAIAELFVRRPVMAEEVRGRSTLHHFSNHPWSDEASTDWTV